MTDSYNVDAPSNATPILVIPWVFGSLEWWQYLASWTPLTGLSLVIDEEPALIIVGLDEESLLAENSALYGSGLVLRLLGLGEARPEHAIDQVAVYSQVFQTATEVANAFHLRRRVKIPPQLVLVAPDLSPGERSSMGFGTAFSPGGPPFPSLALTGTQPSRAPRGRVILPTIADIHRVGAAPVSPDAERDHADPPCTVPANYVNALHTARTATAARKVRQYWSTFREAVGNRDLPIRYLAAIAWRESRMRPEAVGPTDDLGMFQIISSTGAAWGVQDRTNVAESARAAATHLADWYAEGLERYPDSPVLRVAFMNDAYAGYGRARRGLRPDARCRALYLMEIASALEENAP